MDIEFASPPIHHAMLNTAIERARDALDQAAEVLGTPNQRIAPTPIGREALAKALLKGRRRRPMMIPDIDFGEPAWDILLELYVARAAGKSVGVSELCVASAVPPTTALRWITKLEAAGHIERAAHPRHRCQYVLRMADAAFGSIDRWLRWMGAVLG